MALWNTVRFSFSAVVLATVLGLVIGLMRLSRNWLASHIAAGYIDRKSVV